MKKFMQSAELARDERFTRTHIPIEFLMAEEVTLEQIEETFKALQTNEEMKKACRSGVAPPPSALACGLPTIWHR